MELLHLLLYLEQPIPQLAATLPPAHILEEMAVLGVAVVTTVALLAVLVALTEETVVRVDTVQELVKEQQLGLLQTLV
jgi:hypothetical protein